MTELAVRMKDYEFVNRIFLTRRMPYIIRIDGKAFHSFTENFERPFDKVFMTTMQETTKLLCENIEGCKLGYTQSDEISLLLVDYDNLETEAWFNKNIQKIVSVSASMATLYFNMCFIKNIPTNSFSNIYLSKQNKALFDSRVFVLPESEVTNYFVWRQQDACRNSISMLAQAHFSHKELLEKNSSDMQEMLFSKGINYNDLPTPQKRGTCTYKETYMKEEVERTRWVIDENIPIFTQDRNYVEKRFPKTE